MKRLLVYILLLVSIGVSGQNILHRRNIATTSSSGDTLDLWWPFNGSLEDSTSNNLDATFTGTASYGTPGGVNDYYIRVETNEGVNSPSIDLGDHFKLYGWVYFDFNTNAAARPFLTNGDNINGTSGFYLWIGAWAWGGGFDWGFQVYTYDGANRDDIRSNDDIFSAYTWYFVEIEYNNGDWTFTVDGVDQTSGSSTTQTDFNRNGSFTLGNYTNHSTGCPVRLDNWKLIRYD